MKKSILVSILLAFLFCAGNLFAEEETETKPVGTTNAAKTIEDATIEIRGSEIDSNTYYGMNAGASSTGSQNSFYGADSGRNNTTSANCFMGYYAGRGNTGSSVIAMGYYAGYLNQGNNNTFLGSSSGNHNTTGYDNTFLGRLSGRTNVSGDFNTFLGSNAGHDNTSNNNTFVGAYAGYDSTGGTYNVFLGKSAGEGNLLGSSNVFLGYHSGYQNANASGNVFLGTSNGHQHTSGDYNTFIGHSAGYSNATGSGNVFLGKSAGYSETGSNKLYIHNSNDAEPLIWGDFETRNVVINGAFRATASYSSSDQRWKQNIQPLKSSLEKVASLQGVTYEWKKNAFPNAGFENGKHIGLVAQDVEKTIPELVSEDANGFKGVSYTKLTAVLVEAVKELKTENQDQKNLMKEQQHQFEKQLKKQQAEIEELRSMIKKLKS